MGAAKLERLAEKYRALAELAERRESLRAAGGQRFEAAESGARRRLFRELAREFPGALRELDATPTDVLRERHRVAAELVRAGAAELPLWMEVAIAYHAEVREALDIKLWMARRALRKPLSAEIHRAFRRGYARRPVRLRDPDAISIEMLARHAWPPQGRIQSVVWELLELRFERPREELERLLFGASRSNPRD